MTAVAPGLAVEGLVIRRPGFAARYDLAVPAGALAAVTGPSGGGKTTLLGAIAGFVPAEAGRIRLGGADITALRPADRPLSILFQEHNLFPHLTAAQNVAIGLDPRLRLSAGQRREVAAALADVGLAGLEDRRPAALSGGQRQRVALARALARARPLILLDEPFSSLDPDLRRDMVALVDSVRRRLGATVLMVLHTPDDAAAVADLWVRVADGQATVQAAATRHE